MKTNRILCFNPSKKIQNENHEGSIPKIRKRPRVRYQNPGRSQKSFTLPIDKRTNLVKDALNKPKIKD